MANEAQPRLAVILHADVVGSTTLVRQDERLAHQRIHAAFRDVGSVVERYGGTVNEIRGDALVAEFARASDAVLAALTVQEANRAQGAALDDGVVPVLRVGIALGEVVIADATVTGAGVVLAQRLEQLAPPGGVCISGAVREAVPDRLLLDYAALGAQSVKGFEEPVLVFSVAVRPGATLPAPAPPTKLRSGRRVALGVLALSLLVAAAGVAWWTSHPREAAGPNRSASSTTGGVVQSEARNVAPPSPTRADAVPEPSIVVLPFADLSADSGQEYFADGISQDLITDLSKVSELLVIARHSAFAYKGKSVDVRQVADELGVRYVLEGSVRRAGEKIRINAQLIDASTGGHLWAERYDGSLVDVFALQDNITERIVTALAVKLSTTEQAVLKAKGASSREAHEAFLRGMRHLNVRDEMRVDENDKALQAFEKSIELDPNYATAYAALGLTYWNRWALFDFSDGSAKREAFDLADRSLKLADNAMAHRLLARRHLFLEHYGGAHGERRHDLAIAELRKAIALQPNNPDILAELAYYLVFAGEAEEAQALIARAKRLNPNFPDWYYRPSGFIHFVKGEYSSAITDFTVWFESETIPWRSGFALVSALSQAGDIAKAQEVFQDIHERRSHTVIHLGEIDDYFPFKRGSDLGHFLEGLRKAGVPAAPE